MSSIVIINNKKINGIVGVKCNKCGVLCSDSKLQFYTPKCKDYARTDIHFCSACFPNKMTCAICDNKVTCKIKDDQTCDYFFNIDIMDCYKITYHLHCCSYDHLKIAKRAIKSIHIKKFCIYCKRDIEVKYKCSNCGFPYCNRECQKNDWKDHKEICMRR